MIFSNTFVSYLSNIAVFFFAAHSLTHISSKILNSLNAQSLFQSLCFQFVWRGCLSDPPSAMHAPKSEIIYEIIMVLWCSIMLRFRQGVSTVEVGGTPKEAAKLFLEAASLSQ